LKSVKISNENWESGGLITIRLRLSQIPQFTGADSFELSINAAEKAGEAKVLASPNLICRSGKKQIFLPAVISDKILGLRSKEIMWKRYGIGLKNETPHRCTRANESADRNGGFNFGPKYYG